RVRRHEDDRRMGRLAPPANQRGRLVPVHPRHVHVEQNHGEVVRQYLAQRLRPRGGGDNVLLQILKQRLENKHLLGQVVYDENVDFVHCPLSVVRGQSPVVRCQWFIIRCIQVVLGGIHQPLTTDYGQLTTDSYLCSHVLSTASIWSAS